VKLSEHFWLHEFTSSQTAARMGREIVPTPEELANLTKLCVTLLEPVRVKLGRPITITSGLRPLWLNTAIGGSKTSAHMKGFAADIKVVGMSPAVFCKWFKNNYETEGWVFDQCILEFPENGGWTHLGISAEPSRYQFLTATANQNGATQYWPGLIEP
jgi:zinc D-Ala-D-Ala carboxypeptidase